MSPIDPKSFWIDVTMGEDSFMELKSVEFRGDKVSAPRRDSLADEIAAFANGSGGRVVLGVTDGGHPQSLDRSKMDLLVRFVDEICHQIIKPAIGYTIARVPVLQTDGGAILITIPHSRTVHRSPGGYFTRKGASTAMLS